VGDALAGRAARVREGERGATGGRGGLRWGPAETTKQWAVTIPYP
jgi:hypothetical protein